MRYHLILFIMIFTATFAHAESQNEPTPFQRAMQFVLDAEGGYNDNESEPGGASWRGVSKATYDRWRKSQGLQPRPLMEITSKEVVAVYRMIWDNASCGAIAEIDQRLAIVHFDWAFHRQPYTAIKTLQRSVNDFWAERGGEQIDDDGDWGPKTRASVYHANNDVVIRRYLERRKEWYRTGSNPKVRERCLAGWINRLDNLRREIATIQP